MKQNVKDIRKCLRYYLQLFVGGHLSLQETRVSRAGSVLITNKTRAGADTAAPSRLCQSFRELCLLQLLHQQGVG